LLVVKWPIRGRETLIGRGIGRLVLTVVVVHPIRRHEDRPSMTAAALAARIGTGPAHHARPDPPIKLPLSLPSRVHEPEKAAQRQ